ncbi:MAG: hypothetical protein AB1813_26740 [Verrucomicrobiota bacterium]
MFNHGLRTRTGLRFGALIAALLFWAYADQPAPNSSNQRPRAESPSADLPIEIEIRGRIVCLAEEMHRLYQAELPTGHAHLWGLRTENEELYTLLRGKYSEAIFVDAPVRGKELVVKGRLFPKSHLFEPFRMRSVINGVIHDLFYYCEICDIEAVEPAECACCHGPVELREEPLAR